MNSPNLENSAKHLSPEKTDLATLQLKIDELFEKAQSDPALDLDTMLKEFLLDLKKRGSKDYKIALSLCGMKRRKLGSTTVAL